MTPQDYIMLFLTLVALAITAWLVGRYWEELGGVVYAGILQLKEKPKRTERRVVAVRCSCGFELAIPDVPGYNAEMALDSMYEFHDQVCEHPFMMVNIEEIEIDVW